MTDNTRDRMTKQVEQLALPETPPREDPPEIAPRPWTVEQAGDRWRINDAYMQFVALLPRHVDACAIVNLVNLHFKRQNAP